MRLVNRHPVPIWHRLTLKAISASYLITAADLDADGSARKGCHRSRQLERWRGTVDVVDL
jgi:adenosyl cobinamide kinase/adenosyl cobinamide phosphate guanylyltransferase